MVTVADGGMDGYMQNIRVRNYYAVLLGISLQISIHDLKLMSCSCSCSCASRG